jgi:hypothetical protein
MTIIGDVVPNLKRFLSPLGLRDSVLQMVIRMIVAFTLHSGRMSCLQAGMAVRSQARHRAQVSRMLGRPSFRKTDLLTVQQKMLLEEETEKGPFVFLIDATLNGQAGKKTENTYSTGNRQRRKQKKARYGKYKYARKSCHMFTAGLLITPSGIRIPFAIPYYTAEYCKRKKLKHRTTAEAGADLVRSLPLPEGAEVVVLGDTAYESKDLKEACADRQYEWIFPSNAERVFAGPSPRPKVRSRLKKWSSFKLQTIRFHPGQGKYVNYRRLSPHRMGPKAKARTFYVYEERREVKSVGDVRLVYSTKKKNLTKATADEVKILLTNSQRPLREIIELYSLRWQIELFFKELKSNLGFHQYQFKKFECVESWLKLALLTFMYLEWYRLQKLKSSQLSDEERKWWLHQRTHGLCQAVRLATEEGQLRYFAERLQSPGGIKKMKRLLRQSLPIEYRGKL